MGNYSAQLLGLLFVTVHGPQSIIRRVHIYYSLSLPPTPLLKSSVTPVQMPPPTVTESPLLCSPVSL